MTTRPSPSPKLVGPGEGKTVELFRVRFDYKVESADSGGAWPCSRSRSRRGPW